MQDYAKEFGLMKDGWKCLVATYFGEKITLATDYIRWYLNMVWLLQNATSFFVTKKNNPLKIFCIV